MGRASIRGESSTRDKMVSYLLFSCLLLVGIKTTAAAAYANAADRFTRDGTHVRNV